MEMSANILILLPPEIKEALRSKVKTQGLTLSHTIRALILGYSKNKFTLHQEDVVETRDKWHKVTRNIGSDRGVTKAGNKKGEVTSFPQT